VSECSDIDQIEWLELCISDHNRSIAELTARRETMKRQLEEIKERQSRKENK
jgi:prefoldin subunit 5